MRRLLTIAVVLALCASPALGVSFYLSPDVPTDDPVTSGPTYAPWDIVRYDSGVYSLTLSLPVGTALDSLHAMCNGDWLMSVEVPTELPPASGTFFDPRDIIYYDPTLPSYTAFFCGAPIGIPSGSDIDAAFLLGDVNANLVISFDVPTDLTTIGGGLYDPADLIEWTPTGVGCASWGIVGLYFDASAMVPPVSITDNVTGADRGGPTLLTFDVPSTIGVSTYMPGEIVSWDGAAFSSWSLDALWPISSRADAFSLLPDPGEVPSMHVDKSSLAAGDLTITWTAGTSVGAEDYGIYEGTIVSPWVENHGSVVCTDTGSDYTEEITPAAGDRYYLVVALNPDLEGSYGRRSSGAERSPGSSPCRASQGFDCP